MLTDKQKKELEKWFSDEIKKFFDILVDYDLIS